MAPESNSSAVQANVTPGQTVHVPRPENGAPVAVASSPGGTLELAFDPSTATVNRVDNDLIFELDGGGTVTLNDFFAVGDESLPNLRLPDGTELASADFFQGSGLDMTTAVGPGAGSASGSGTSYNDDPGSLLDGLDKYGKLGTDYWGRESEQDEEFTGVNSPGGGLAATPTDPGTPPVDPVDPPVDPVDPPIDPVDPPVDPVDPPEPVAPGGEFGVSVTTDGVLGLYEDAQPDQHVGDKSIHAGRINLDITPAEGSEVSEIRLSDFPEGTQLYLGDPANGGTLLTPVDGVYTFNPGDFTGSGVYVIAPKDSDDDFTFTAEVDFTADGNTVTVTGTVDVIVDAVADQPDVLDSGIDAPSYHGPSLIAENDDDAQRFEDGWAKDSLSASDNGVNSTNVNIPVHVSVSFSDYTDQSEAHFVLIERPGEGTWDCIVNGVAYGPDSVITLQVDANGVPLTDQSQTGAYTKDFFQIPVDNADLQANGGVADIDATLVNYQYGGGDRTISIQTGGMAVESPSDNELRLDNNVSYNFGNAAQEVHLDVIDSTLNVNVGWFYEDGDGAKHGDAGHSVPDAVSGATNDGASAKVDINLGNAGTDEYISHVELTYDSNLGSLEYDVPAGWIVTETTDPDTGVTTVAITTDGRPDSLGDMNMVFKPADGFGDNDIPLGYQVTVVDSDSGASAEFSGNSVVVVDAVADLGAFGEEGLNAGYEFTPADPGTDPAAEPGSEVKISGSITFPDTADGSEYHYIVANIPGDWGVKGLSDLLSKDQIREGYINPVSGHDFQDGDVKISDSGNDAFLLLEMRPVDMVENGTYTMENGVVVRLVVDNGVATYTYSVPGGDGPFATVTQDLDSGKADFTFNVQAPGHDSSETVYVQGVSVEKDPSVEGGAHTEYDYANNLAVTEEGVSVPVRSDAVTSEVYVQFFMHEDDQPNQYQIDPVTGQKDVTTAGGDPAHGYKIIIGLVDPEAADGKTSTDQISQLTLKNIPDSDQGTLWYTPDNGATWVEITDADAFMSQYPNPSPDGFHFNPSENWSGEIIGFEVTAEISSPSSGHTSDPKEPVLVDENGQIVTDTDGSYQHGTDMYVDSVADLADLDVSAGRGTNEKGQIEVSDKDIISTPAEHDGHGWFTSEHGAEQQYTVDVKLGVLFGDTDGSETGSIQIDYKEGVQLFYPDGSAVELVTASDGTPQYWLVDSGQIGGQDGALDSGNWTLKAVVDTSVKDGANLTVRVVTEEGKDGDSRNVDANDTAVNEKTVSIEMPTLESTLEIKVGWAYEDHDANKFGGTATGGPNDAIGSVNPLEGANGVPIIINFTGNNGEQLVTADGAVTFRYNSTMGDLYLNGFKITTNPDADGWVEVRVQPNQYKPDGKLTFKPNAGYSDEDIDLQYSARVTDSGEGATFIVSGTTKVVMDAVADQATHLSAQDKVVYDGNADASAGIAGEDATLSFTVNFKPDASETRFVLIPGGEHALLENMSAADLSAQGLRLLSPEEVEALGLAVQGTGLDGQLGGYHVYVVDSNALDANGNLTINLDVTFKEGLTGDAAKDLEIKTVVVEGKGDGGEWLGNNKGLWDAHGKDQDGNVQHEYDFSNNVAITDVNVEVKVGMVSSDLTMTVGFAYEDNNPGQHTATPDDDYSDGARITIGGFDAQGNETITELQISFKAPLDADGNYVSDPGTFKYGNTVYSLANGNMTMDNDGNVTLTIENFNPNQNFFYRPGLNDSDADIDMSFSATVRDDASGKTETFGGTQTVLIDAVADLPTYTGAQTSIDGGNEKADWGSEITLTVNSTFYDFADNSEQHYLLVEASPGWTCGNADGVVTIDGKLYFYKHVANPGHGEPGDVVMNGDGTASFDFALTAPESGYSYIANDQSLTLKAGGVAVEGELKGGQTGTDGSISINGAGKPVDGNGTALNQAQPDYSRFDENNQEHTTSNNVAVNTGDVTIGFNTINQDKGETKETYEDHDNKQHLGTASTVDSTSGVITLSLYNSAASDGTSNDSIDSGALTFKYTGSGRPGSFSYDGGEIKYGDMDPVTNEPLYYQQADGTYVVRIPSGAIDGDTVTVRYNPPANDSTDLTNFEYSLNVSANDSKAAGVVGGPVNEGGANEGKLVVDAVADKPLLTGKDPSASYQDDANRDPKADPAAKPGDTVSIQVNDVTFKDYTDNSEDHYIVVQRDGVTLNGKGSVDLGRLGDQVITVTGDNGVTQTITIEGGKATVEIRHANGDPVSSRDLTATEYNALVNGAASDAKHQEGVADGSNYYRVPVLNEFLQLTGGGKVSTTVDIKVPGTALDGDSTYTIKAGGLAVDHEAPGDGHLKTNNDEAQTIKDVNVEVNIVTSHPAFEVTTDRIYENLTPDANLGVYDRTGGAVIQMTDLHKGETADIILTFSAHEKSGEAVDFSGGKVQIVINGQVVGEVSVGADGKAVIDDLNIDQYRTAQNPDPKVEFVLDPGENYSDADITVGYDVTVTDPASGHQNHWQNTDSQGDGYESVGLGIVVDAVAQRPVMGDDLIPDYQATGGTGAFVPGDELVLRTEITFQDYDPTDNSENHYLLVTANAGWERPTSVVIIDSNGEPHEVAITDDMICKQKYDGEMYWRIQIPNGMIDKYGQDGTIDVQVWMDSPADAKSGTSFKVGAAAHEYDMGETSTEIRTDNNTAFVIGKEVSVSFAKAGGFAIGDGKVYENDTPDANTNYDPTGVGGGTLSITMQGDDRMENFSFDNPQAIGNAGTMYLVQGGQRYEMNTDGSFTVNGKPTVITGSDHFQFVPRENYSDKDLELKYSGTVVDKASGDTNTITGGTATIIVDAVAQKPVTDHEYGEDAIVIDHDHRLGESTTTVKINVTATFKDFDPADGSESHYVLISVLPNAWVINPVTGGRCDIFYDTDGAAYYKYPVDGKLDGSGTFSGDVEMVFTDRQLEHDNWENTTTDTLKVGSLAVESKVEDGEITYHNNVAFDSDNAIDIVHQWPDRGPGHLDVWVNPAFENDTPVAHTDDPDQPGIQPNESATGELGGEYADAGRIYFNASGSVKDIDIEWDKDAGSIWVNGTEHTGGSVTVKPTDDVRFVPDHNYKDGDTSISFTGRGDNGFTTGAIKFPVIIDAVAQKPEGLDFGADYGDKTTDPADGKWTAVGEKDESGNEGVVMVTVSGKFHDYDDSENHYVLIEKQPGFAIDDSFTGKVTEVYIEGKTYYQIDVSDLTPDSGGRVSIDVPIKLDKDCDGLRLQTGLMTEESNMGDASNLESRVDNNVSWNLSPEGALVIEVSKVESTIQVKGPEYVFEMEARPDSDAAAAAQGAPVNVNLALDNNDVADEFTFTFDPAQGEFFYTGSATGKVTIDNVNGTVTVTGPLTGGDLNGFTFRPSDYSDDDVTINWSCTVHDPASGDEKTFGDKIVVIVDAVANAPVIEGKDSGSQDGQYDGAKSGGMVAASVSLSFQDLDGSEKHYAVIEKHGEWLCDHVMIDGVRHEVTTIFNEDGRPFYAVEITNEMLGVSTPPKAGETPKDVQVDFVLNAPSGSQDVSQNLQIGGISVEETDGLGTDKEQTLNNNWAESLTNVEVNMAMVQTEDVDLSTAGKVIENHADGIDLSFSGITDAKEVVTESTFTMTQQGTAQGGLIGNIIYNGQTIPVYAGVAVKVEFADGGLKDGDDFRFVLADGNHNDNPVKVSSNTRVEDASSGDFKFIGTEAGGEATILVDARADAPVQIGATDPTGTYQSGGTAGTVTFTVTATFPDHDGSESHFVLVEKPAGWGNPAGYDTYPANPAPGDTVYYKVPVTGAVYGPNGEVEVSVKVQTPTGLTEDKTHTLQVGGMAVEKANGNEAVELNGDTVGISVGVVQATGVSMNAAAIHEDMAGDGVYGSKLTFAVQGGNNDSLTELKITLPKGSAIVDQDGKVIYDATSSAKTFTINGEAALDILQGENANTTYYYRPPANVSGNHELTYTATVKDDNSGASQTWTGVKGSVPITAVTDAPASQSNTDPSVTNAYGHTASVDVTLKASFPDTTGTETHFFLMQLPAGVTQAPSGWTKVTDTDYPGLKAACGLDGDVYIQTVSSTSANPSVSLTFSGLGQGYNGSLTYMAGSFENTTGVAPADRDYGFLSDANNNPLKGSATITTADSINFAPDVADSAAGIADALRGAGVPAEGRLQLAGGRSTDDQLKDADGDNVTVTGVKFGETAASESEDGSSWVVKGQYGTLVIDKASGEYTYTLDADVRLEPNAKVSENFDVSVADQGYGAADAGRITINLNAPNTNPNAGNITVEVGGKDETEMAMPVTGKLDLANADADGDDVSLTGVTGHGGTSSLLTDAAGDYYEVQGQYGVLKFYTDGTYEYRLTNEGADGKDTFTVAYRDEFGGTGSSSIIMDVSPVNHRPVAVDEPRQFYTDTSGSAVLGTLTFSDPDAGDSARVQSITYNNAVYTANASGVILVEPAGEGFRLEVRADGSYAFTPNSGWSTGTGHSFTFTVSDGSLTDTGEMFFGKGAESDFISGHSVGSFATLGTPGLVDTDTGTASDTSGSLFHPVFASDAGTADGGADTLAGGHSGNDTLAAVLDGGDTPSGAPGGGDALSGSQSGEDALTGGPGGEDTLSGSQDDSVSMTEEQGDGALLGDLIEPASGYNGEDADSGGEGLFMGTGSVSFSDIFGVSGSVDGMLVQDSYNGQDTVLTYDSGAPQAAGQVLDNSQLQTTLHGGQDSICQGDVVDLSTTLCSHTQQVDDDVAQSILEAIIKNNS